MFIKKACIQKNILKGKMYLGVNQMFFLPDNNIDVSWVMSNDYKIHYIEMKTFWEWLIN